MAVLDALERKQGFTDTEDALADYVIAHPDEVAGMNIGQLSSVTHTSNAAVVRLCRKIGLDGYRDFRIQLAREVERSRSHVLDVNPDHPFFEGASTRDIMSSVAAVSKQAIDATYDTVATQSIVRAARYVAKARYVVLYAVGDSRVSAEGFANLLLKLGINCINGVQRGDNIVVSHFLDSRDVAIVITHSGMVFEDYRDPISRLSTQGCRIVAITANEHAIDGYAGSELILLPKGETRAGRVATYYSQACIRYVLNCIYGEIFATNYRKNIELRDRYVQDDIHS